MGTSAVIDAAGLAVFAAPSPPSALCRRRHDWQLPRTPTTLFSARIKALGGYPF